MTSEAIRQMLFNVIDELNRLLPREEHIEKDMRTLLAGDSGRLDSAGLINLIVLAEQLSARELGRVIRLTDDRTLSQISAVFRTVGSLADYIQLLLDENPDA